MKQNSKVGLEIIKRFISSATALAILLSMSIALVAGLPDAAFAGRRSLFSIFIGRDLRLKIINTGPKLAPDTSLSDGPVSVTLISPTNYKLRYVDIGDYYYLDRGYTFVSGPAAIRGKVWIVGNDADQLSTSSSFIQFEISDTARVYVLYDGNATSLPSWMTGLGFTATGQVVTTSDPVADTLLVYRKVMVKGVIRLGGNEGATTGAKCNYVVVVRRPVNGDLGAPSQLATTEMLLPRTGHRLVKLDNGKILIVGGVDSLNTLVTRAELYDSTTQTFIATGTMGQGRINPAAVKLTDGRVLVIGGADIGSVPVPLASCEIYDPATQMFTPTGDLSWSRRMPEAIRLVDGQVFVSGGVDTDSSGDVRTNMYGDGVRTTEIYNPATSSWTPGPYMLSVGPYNTVEPGKRYGHRMALLPDGRVLIAGGLWHGPELGDYGMTGCDIYDPVSNTISAGAPMNTPRGRFGLVDIGGGKIMAMGGLWYQENDPLNPAASPLFASTADAEVYDAVTNVWTKVAQLPRGMYDFAVASPDPNRVLLFDGYDLVGTEAGDILLYDGIFNTWTLVGNLVTSRSFPFSTCESMVVDVGSKDFFLCGGVHYNETTKQTTLLTTGERFKY